MAKHLIKTEQTDTVVVDEGNSEWLVAKGVTLTGAPALWNSNLDNVTFDIRGKIATDGRGISSIGDMSGEAADNTLVKIAASGGISSEDDGIVIEGAGARVENAGSIRSADYGVNIESNDTLVIVNQGTISSEQSAAIRFSSTTGFLIRNDGLIEAENAPGPGYNRVAIYSDASGAGKLINGVSGVIDGELSFTQGAADKTVINKGEILGSDILNTNTKIAIEFGSGDDTLVNRGKISGLTQLGSGNDIADLRKSVAADGTVHGETGDDVFIIDSNMVSIWEQPGGGNDTVRTTVSYALGNDFKDHIETLMALGKKDISLTGNDMANTLKGNAGDNSLAGGAGDDVLSGGAGDDVLSGGDGADNFYFRKNSGDDTILELQPGEDIIHFVNIPGIGDMAELESHFTIAKNGDVIIDLGKHGSIRLDGIDETEVGQVEFHIDL